jgi:DNA-binding transcriptional ArsR family regulator
MERMTFMVAELTTFLSQPTREAALTGLFASGTRPAVLRLFMLDPTRAYYQRQIEGAIGIPIRAIQRELERLTTVGLLYRRVEGNRTYYHVDTQFPLFPELRNMVLKTASDEDRLRGQVATDESVRLAFLLPEERQALVVTQGGELPSFAVPNAYDVRVWSVEAFSRALLEDPAELAPFLQYGVDLLGRREDVVWRRIEAAGYTVRKGKGVA